AARSPWADFLVVLRAMWDTTGSNGRRLGRRLQESWHWRGPDSKPQGSKQLILYFSIQDGRVTGGRVNNHSCCSWAPATALAHGNAPDGLPPVPDQHGAAILQGFRANAEWDVTTRAGSGLSK